MIAGAVLLVVLGAIGVAIAIDLVLESTVRSTVDLTVLGVGVTELSSRGFAMVAVGIAAAGALLVAFGLAFVVRTRLREVGRTFDRLSAENAGFEAKNRLLRSRIVELERQLDALAEESARARAEAEEQPAQAPAPAMRDRRHRRDVERGERVVVVPEVEVPTPEPEGAAEPTVGGPVDA